MLRVCREGSIAATLVTRPHLMMGYVIQYESRQVSKVIPDSTFDEMKNRVTGEYAEHASE